LVCPYWKITKNDKKSKTPSRHVSLWHPAFSSIKLIDRPTETNTTDTPKEQIHSSVPFLFALNDQFCYLADEDREKDLDTLKSFFVEGVDFILSSNKYF
jgi:hypothetical protein